MLSGIEMKSKSMGNAGSTDFDFYPVFIAVIVLRCLLLSDGDF